MPDTTTPQINEVLTFTVTREFEASRELIWSAFMEPQQLINFFGPEGTSIPIESVTIEPRDGGAFCLTMVEDDSGKEHGMEAVYKELVKPERIVFETAGGITGTIELMDLGDGKTQFNWTTRAAISEDFLANAKAGTNSAADLLGKHLATIQK